MPTSPLYAVFGQPVAHSLSPLIHARFAAQTGRTLRYEAVEASPERFPELLSSFAARGGRGANVTLPLKAAALTLADEAGEFARRVGAANTLTRTHRGWRADNTDGRGLIADLAERHRIDLRGRRVLLLGAGGAAHAAAFALLDAGIDELMIANRSPERADRLADRIGEPARVHTRYLEDLGRQGAFDLIVNATSAGHEGRALPLPASLLGARCVCYDMSYSLAAVPFLAWARAAGAQLALDGLGMLVEQAAESFLIWHGVRPETEEILAELRHRLPAQAVE
ncbi:MAG: shikimate dehydrogenase [Xanthomonadales bacterium]|nr:shikimate dehydrogenase [Xanthomonadales bacterium]